MGDLQCRRKPPPAISAWLARICSIRLVPERGMPTMKIGLASRSPTPDRSPKNASLNVARIPANRCSTRSPRVGLRRRCSAFAFAGARTPARSRGGPRSPSRGRSSGRCGPRPWRVRRRRACAWPPTPAPKAHAAQVGQAPVGGRAGRLAGERLPIAGCRALEGRRRARAGCRGGAAPPDGRAAGSAPAQQASRASCARWSWRSARLRLYQASGASGASRVSVR